MTDYYNNARLKPEIKTFIYSLILLQSVTIAGLTKSNEYD